MGICFKKNSNLESTVAPLILFFHMRREVFFLSCFWGLFIYFIELSGIETICEQDTYM